MCGVQGVAANVMEMQEPLLNFFAGVEAFGYMHSPITCMTNTESESVIKQSHQHGRRARLVSQILLQSITNTYYRKIRRLNVFMCT